SSDIPSIIKAWLASLNLLKFASIATDATAISPNAISFILSPIAYSSNKKTYSIFLDISAREYTQKVKYNFFPDIVAISIGFFIPVPKGFLKFVQVILISLFLTSDDIF